MATGYCSAASSTGRSSTSTALTTIPYSILVCCREPKLALALPRKVVHHVLRKKKKNNGILNLIVCKMMRQSGDQADHEKTTADTRKVADDQKNRYWDDHQYHSVNVSRVEERLARKKMERNTYLFAAILSTLGISSLAVMAVYYRFSCQMLEGGEIPVVEMFGTFALSVGAAVGMEFWARWAHRALWHASLWHMHESHHRPRDGAFELNDVFAIMNAVPAVALLAFGFFNTGLIPGLCFGAGLGITVFGMAYMFVHDGLVHRRFQVGPIAHVPYLRKVAAAHQLHHAEKFNGVPYGLFLGPQELEEVGGLEELEKEIKRRI